MQQGPNYKERIFWNKTSNDVVQVSARSEIADFHRKLPGYAVTPLRQLPEVAKALGLDQFWLKDESCRLTLPAFKILGASWAIYRATAAAILQRGSTEPPQFESVQQWSEVIAPLGALTFVAATDGNHGRAVARMARLLSQSAHILVPADMAEARIDSIKSEGAIVEIVQGTYDDAIDASAEYASEHRLVISDTAWAGYHDVPAWVIEGYSTIFAECQDQLSGVGPEIVAVQMGVGAFASAAAQYFAALPGKGPILVGVEPTHAACVLASIEAGELVKLPGPHDSIMSGLNCGTASELAWPVLKAGIDCFIAIDDERTRQAMRLLAASGVVAGECGAASLAGLMLLAEAGELNGRSALVVSTEGATDPIAYQKIIGN